MEIIEIIIAPPVEKKHRLKEGRVMETVTAPKGTEELNGVWVQGRGEKIRLLYGEYKVIGHNPNSDK